MKLKRIIKIILLSIVAILLFGYLFLFSNILGLDKNTPVFLSDYGNWAWEYSRSVFIIYKDGSSISYRLSDLPIPAFSHTVNTKIVTVLNKLGIVKRNPATDESKEFLTLPMPKGGGFIRSLL